LGNSCAVDKDWNDANVALKRRFDLDPDEIVRIVEPAQPVLVGGGNPVPSDDGNERVTSADAISQDIEPVNAKVDVVDVEETLSRSNRCTTRSWIARAANAVSSRR